MNLDAVKIINKLEGLTIPQGMVLYQLAMFQNSNTGQCNPSLSLLAQHCHASKSTIAKTLKQLETAGLIVRESPPRSSNQRTNYRLTLPAEVVRLADSRPAKVSATRTAVVRETDSSSPRGGRPVVRETDSHRSVSEVGKEVGSEIGAPPLADGIVREVPHDWQPDPGFLSMRLRTQPLPNGLRWEDVLADFQGSFLNEPKPARDLDMIFWNWCKRRKTWQRDDKRQKPSQQTRGEAHVENIKDSLRGFLNDE